VLLYPLGLTAVIVDCRCKGGRQRDKDGPVPGGEFGADVWEALLG